MKELLTLPHCLAVVVSQHSSDRGSGGSSSSGGGSGGGSGGEEFDQQTLVVLKDATPSSSATWLCVPFVRCVRLAATFFHFHLTIIVFCLVDGLIVVCQPIPGSGKHCIR